MAEPIRHLGEAVWTVRAIGSLLIWISMITAVIHVITGSTLATWTVFIPLPAGVLLILLAEHIKHRERWAAKATLWLCGTAAAVAVGGSSLEYAWGAPLQDAAKPWLLLLSGAGMLGFNCLRILREWSELIEPGRGFEPIVSPAAPRGRGSSAAAAEGGEASGVHQPADRAR